MDYEPLCKIPVALHTFKQEAKSLQNLGRLFTAFKSQSPQIPGHDLQESKRYLDTLNELQQQCLYYDRLLSLDGCYTYEPEKADALLSSGLKAAYEQPLSPILRIEALLTKTMHCKQIKREIDGAVTFSHTPDAMSLNMFLWRLGLSNTHQRQRKNYHIDGQEMEMLEYLLSADTQAAAIERIEAAKIFKRLRDIINKNTGIFCADLELAYTPANVLSILQQCTGKATQVVQDVSRLLDRKNDKEFRL